MHNNKKNAYLLNMPPGVAQRLKIFLSFPRYYVSLMKGNLAKKKFGKQYNQKLLFIAGLPKSGTTWLERMLSSYPGITPILPYEATIHEMKYKSSCEYDFSENMLSRLKGGIFLVKMHSYGSKNNVVTLRSSGVKYCILYRDLRDIAVSQYFYIKRNPFHPENQEYRNLSVREGIEYFCEVRLDEYVKWIRSWHENRDEDDSIIITYEELRYNTVHTFQKILELFELDHSPAKIEQIVELNRASRRKVRGRNVNPFLRKGIAGDWKNYFDDEIKQLFKEKVGQMLIQLGYEEDYNW